MSVKVYKPSTRINEVIDGTDQLDDHVHQIALNEYLPRLIQRQRNAVMGDRTPVWYYQVKKFGSLCSCWMNTSRKPSAGCNVCFGTGRVGGYNKIGTNSIIIHPNYPNLTLINVELNDSTVYDADSSRPTIFQLSEDKLIGIVQGSINSIPSGIDAIDYLRLYSTGNVSAFISKESPISWIDLNKSNLLSLINENKILFRIKLERNTLTDDLPYFTHLLMRFQISEMIFYTDKPRISQAISMEDFGLEDAYQSTQYYFTADLKTSSTEDFFYDLLSKNKWKITEIQDNRPLNILTSWDISARLIQTFETIYSFPV